ncbi:MAG: hypothetical protein Q8R57_07490, partial [Bacteroidota bacterium]|nr:hypothetical protein [Bacteroidota bacterium]
KNLTTRWFNAVLAITKNKWKYRLQPFEQILDYYNSIQLLLSRTKHKILWLNGAYYLVSDLTEAYDMGLITSGNSMSGDFYYLKQIMKRLNSEICNFAIEQFNRLLFGDLKNTPKIGLEAYKFDRDFIIIEQRDIAYPVYELYKDSQPDALSLMNDLFNHKGIWSFLQQIFDQTSHYIPVIPGLIDSDLTKNVDIPNTIEKTRFGQDGRILIPLIMLYPNFYFYYDNIQIIPELKRSKLASDLLKQGNTKGYNIVYSSYTKVNRKLINIFK